MLVEKCQNGKKTKYRLYDAQEVGRNPRQIFNDNFILKEPNIENKDPEAYIKMLTKKKVNVNMDHISVVTVTLQDVVSVVNVC